MYVKKSIFLNPFYGFFVWAEKENYQLICQLASKADQRPVLSVDKSIFLMDFVDLVHPTTELNPKNHGTYLITTQQIVLDGPYF